MSDKNEINDYGMWDIFVEPYASFLSDLLWAFKTGLKKIKIFLRLALNHYSH
jgi:hypothetical protein